MTKNILKDFWGWENWCEKLLLRHASRDARSQPLKLCAVHQQVLGRQQSRAALDLSTAETPGTAVPSSYLDVALLGPGASPAKSQRRRSRRSRNIRTGLVGRVDHPSKDEFLEYWSSLRHLMPRSDLSGAPSSKTRLKTCADNLL